MCELLWWDQEQAGCAIEGAGAHSRARPTPRACMLTPPPSGLYALGAEYFYSLSADLCDDEASDL